MQYSCAYLQAATITIMGIFLRKSPIFPARNDFNNILRLRVFKFQIGKCKPLVQRLILRY